MRRILLLAVVPALLLSFAAPARAEEDEALARLEKRVEMLLDLVADLRQEVVQLRTRVAELEVLRESTPSRVRATAEHRIAIPQRATPAPDVIESVEGTAVAPASLAGVWVMDREASIELMLERAAAMAESAEEEADIREMVETTFADVAMTLDLKADGTFHVRMSGMGDEGRTAGGTWTRKDEVVTIVTTHENGEERETPDDAIRGTWKDGRIVLAEDDEEFVVIFVRQK